MINQNEIKRLSEIFQQAKRIADQAEPMIKELKQIKYEKGAQGANYGPLESLALNNAKLFHEYAFLLDKHANMILETLPKGLQAIQLKLFISQLLRVTKSLTKENIEARRGVDLPEYIEQRLYEFKKSLENFSKLAPKEYATTENNSAAAPAAIQSPLQIPAFQIAKETFVAGKVQPLSTNNPESEPDKAKPHK